MTEAFADSVRHCPRCQRWHPLPACAHNAEAICTSCGRKVGYRATGDDGEAVGDGTQCWRCAVRVEVSV